MVLLSPPKLLMILVIALIVLGPDKLPSTARRIGALWSDVKRWRTHLESEVRSTFPDLPSTTEIVRTVRSPISMLDRLADEHGAMSGIDPASAAGGTTAGQSSSSGHSTGDPPFVSSTPPVEPQAHPAPRVEVSAEPDVPSMN